MENIGKLKKINIYIYARKGLQPNKAYIGI